MYLKKRMALFVAERYDKKKTPDGAGVHFLLVYSLHFKLRAPVLLVIAKCKYDWHKIVLNTPCFRLFWKKIGLGLALYQKVITFVSALNVKHYTILSSADAEDRKIKKLVW